MALVEVSALIEASPADVWKDISQLGSHQEWMSDAESIAFVGDTTSGIGTIMEVVTKVGPFRTTDVMEFIAWDPPKTMAVLHRGSFEGTGTFSLDAEGDGATRLWWREELRFPWYFAGPIGARIATPILRRIWRGNLKRLAARF